MRSYDVLRQAADRIGVKALAACLRLSPALIYKWCQEYDPDNADTGGARNPLDRLYDIVRETGDRGVVDWLCQQTGGFFVENPQVTVLDIDMELLLHTQRLVNEFSQLLATVTKSIEDDGEIEPSEADRIRIAWEPLKQTIEGFVIACERGLFRSRGSS